GYCSFDLSVEEHYLSNGMKVISLEKPNVSVVAFAIYYRVGSIDEIPGKTGLAHYCEHMMFKTTQNLEGESFARLLGAVGGGHSNANTSLDRTCYHETVPADRLELVIRLEAERMANLQPTPEEAAKELEVVKEELRLNYLDDPEGRLRFELYQHAFDKHPYRTITIGKLQDVSGITYDDLMAFQRQYYCPANAFAVVVGNFETEKLLNLMETFFGSITPGKRRLEDYPVEEEQAIEKRFVIDMPVRKPSYRAGYKIPGAQNPDNLALQVLCAILSRGGSTPLGRLSQGEDPVAMYAFAYCRPSLDPELLIMGGVPLSGVTPEMLETRIDEVIQNIVDEGITQNQLDKARQQLLAQTVYGMQSSMGIAFSLGEAEIVGSWKDSLSLEEKLDKLTVHDINSVARKYLKVSNRTVGIVQNRSTLP
ncbi:insulinase family protein, partial [bacterium]|nr:insulinase family protein [candidate division CSSED10-310 bacterium]